jgi:hypothetical protein
MEQNMKEMWQIIVLKTFNMSYWFQLFKHGARQFASSVELDGGIALVNLLLILRPLFSL